MLNLTTLWRELRLAYSPDCHGVGIIGRFTSTAGIVFPIAVLNRYLAENDRKKLNYMWRYVPDGKDEMLMQLHLEIVSKYIRTGVKSKLTP